MSFVFTHFLFMVTFGGSIQLALLENAVWKEFGF